MPQENFLTEEKEFTYMIPDFLGGVQSYITYTKTPINALWKAKNCVYNRGGYLQRRPGLNQIGGEFLSTDTGVSMVAAGAKGKRKLYLWHKYNFSGSNDGYTCRAWDGSTWLTPSPNSSSTTSGREYPVGGSWFRENDGTEKVMFHNPLGSSRTFTITAAATAPAGAGVATMNNLRLILDFLDRLWNGGEDGDDRDRILYSEIGIPEGTTTASPGGRTIKFDGQTVVSLVPFKNTSLLIGTESSIYILLVGQSANLLDWEKLKVSNDIGVGAPFTTSTGRDDIFFVDQDGNVRTMTRTLQEISGTVEPVPLSFPIKDKIDAISGSEIDFMTAAFLNGKYYISGHTGAIDATNGTGYVFDTFVNAWTGPMTYAAQQTADDTASNVTAMTTIAGLFGSSAQFPEARSNAVHVAWKAEADSKMVIGFLDPDIFQDDDDEASPLTIHVDIETRPHDLEAPFQDKQIKWIVVEYGDEQVAYSGTGAFVVYAKKNFASTWTELCTIDYDNTTKISTRRVYMSSMGFGRIWQWRFTDESATDGPKVRRMWIRFFANPPSDQDLDESSL